MTLFQTEAGLFMDQTLLFTFIHLFVTACAWKIVEAVESLHPAVLFQILVFIYFSLVNCFYISTLLFTVHCTILSFYFSSLSIENSGSS